MYIDANIYHNFAFSQRWISSMNVSTQLFFFKIFYLLGMLIRSVLLMMISTLSHIWGIIFCYSNLSDDAKPIIKSGRCLSARYHCFIEGDSMWLRLPMAVLVSAELKQTVREGGQDPPWWFALHQCFKSVQFAANHRASLARQLIYSVGISALKLLLPQPTTVQGTSVTTSQW